MKEGGLGLEKTADWNIAAMFRYETYWEPLGSLGA